MKQRENINTSIFGVKSELKDAEAGSMSRMKSAARKMSAPDRLTGGEVYSSYPTGEMLWTRPVLHGQIRIVPAGRGTGG